MENKSIDTFTFILGLIICAAGYFNGATLEGPLTGPDGMLLAGIIIAVLS